MLRALLERSFWKIAGLLSTKQKVRGVDFIFVNARGDRFLQELAPVLEQALDRVTVAGPKYRTLVENNLKFVAAAKVRSDYVSVPAQGYVSAFTSEEANSPHYLAANLIWASEFIRFSRTEQGSEKRADRDVARSSAREAQLRFVREFPDADAWVEFLQRHST